jgi:hypothetical protein
MYKAGLGTWSAASATFSSAAAMDFTQIDDLIVATDISTGPMYKTAGSVSNFASLSGPGAATHVGVINQFLVFGRFANTGTTSDRQIKWSAIGDPTNWPTPGSDTAIATQAGTQFFDWSHGQVTGIISGDQHGIIFQNYATHRMTYVGPPAVFQFDMVDEHHGAFFDYGSIRIGMLTYFISREGFFVTDGVSVKNISDRKIWRTFQNSSSGNQYSIYTHRLKVAADLDKQIIYWSYISSANLTAIPDQMIIYNYREDRWSHAAQSAQFIFGVDKLLDPGLVGGLASLYPGAPFGMSGEKLGTFSGTAGTATIITGEVEPNPGGCAYINGVKPVIASSGTAPTIGVQVGSRDDQSASVSYAGTVIPTSRTGFADFRADNRYHRARLFIAGNFDKAQGIEVDATATGGM